MGACPVVEMSGCFSQVITSLVKCFFTVMTENFGKILRWRKSGSVENPGFFVPSRYVGKNKGQKAQKSEMLCKPLGKPLLFHDKDLGAVLLSQLCGIIGVA